MIIMYYLGQTASAASAAAIREGYCGGQVGLIISQHQVNSKAAFGRMTVRRLDARRPLRAFDQNRGVVVRT
jgi:hypothetical protein